jgi:hypothetical protein
MLKCNSLSSTCSPIWGGEFLSKPNEEVLTTTTSQGDTSFMVCRNDEQNKNQKICMDVNNQTQQSQNKSQSSSKKMLDNNTYDLMEQLLTENKSLWRIKNSYKNDAATDNETKQLWNTIEKDKEELIQMLSEKLRERL